MARLSKNPLQTKLKIGFVFDDSLDSTDGVAQYVKTLGAWFSDQGHRVSYLAGETKLEKWHGGRIYSLSKNAAVSFNANRLSSPLPASSREIQKILALKKFDVLHVQVPYSPLLAQKIIRQANPATAVVGTFHILPAGRSAALGSKLLKTIYGKSLKRFDAALAVSQPAAEFAKMTLGMECQVLPNVVNLEKFNKGKVQPVAGRIVFLGRLVKRKGAMELLRAFNKLSVEVPSAKLEIAGDGPLKSQLKKYVKKNGLENQVRFRGYISEQNKPALLASAQVACFPSLAGETFGIVLIEAMAAGSGPVLGGDNPGYRSVLARQPKLLVNPTDSMALAKRLKLLLSDKTLNNSLRAWQTTYVKQYDVSVVGPKIERVYRQAIAKRHKKGDN